MKNIKKLMLIAVIFAAQAQSMEQDTITVLNNLGNGIVYYAQRHVGDKAEKLFDDLDRQEAGLALMPSGHWPLKPWYWCKKKILEYKRNNALSAIEEFTYLHYEDSPELNLLKNTMINKYQGSRILRALVARHNNLAHVF